LNDAFHLMLGGMHNEMGTCFVIMDEGYSPSRVHGSLQMNHYAIIGKQHDRMDVG